VCPWPGVVPRRDGHPPPPSVGKTRATYNPLPLVAHRRDREHARCGPMPWTIVSSRAPHPRRRRRAPPALAEPRKPVPGHCRPSTGTLRLVERVSHEHARQHAVSLVPSRGTPHLGTRPAGRAPGPSSLTTRGRWGWGVSPPTPLLSSPVRHSASPCVRILRLFLACIEFPSGAARCDFDSALAYARALFVVHERVIEGCIQSFTRPLQRHSPI
jgi:hypothetical protein